MRGGRLNIISLEIVLMNKILLYIENLGWRLKTLVHRFFLHLFISSMVFITPGTFHANISTQIHPTERLRDSTIQVHLFVICQSPVEANKSSGAEAVVNSGRGH